MRITAKQVKKNGISNTLSQLAGVVTQLRLENEGSLSPEMVKALQTLSDTIRNARDKVCTTTTPSDRINSGIWTE